MVNDNNFWGKLVILHHFILIYLARFPLFIWGLMGCWEQPWYFNSGLSMFKHHKLDALWLSQWISQSILEMRYYNPIAPCMEHLATFTPLNGKNKVGKYTIHGAYGRCNQNRLVLLAQHWGISENLGLSTECVDWCRSSRGAPGITKKPSTFHMEHLKWLRTMAAIYYILWCSYIYVPSYMYIYI